MSKQIVIDTCGECSYFDCDMPMSCDHIHGPNEVNEIDEIHPDCPLDDHKDYKAVLERVKERLKTQFSIWSDLNAEYHRQYRITGSMQNVNYSEGFMDALDSAFQIIKEEEENE